jgi:pyruvate dehydrogenase E1 component alpha subunit
MTQVLSVPAELSQAAASQAAPWQLVSPAGVLDEAAAAQVPGITAELVRGLYRDMTLGRRLDQEGYALQRQGELGLWLMSLGQEAAQAGSIRAIRGDDHVFPSYREHVAALARGITPRELLTQWRGATHAGWDPARYRFQIYCLVLANQALHATGYAMGVRADRSDEIVLAYLGDGASSQGDASEALNWSCVVGAPIVFFCQNNQWAISTPASRQTRTPLHRRAAGFGLQAGYVDGNDVLAVYVMTRHMAEEVRAGGPPGFIEALTYRMSGHSTSDDPRRYRDQAELEFWERHDPLTRIRLLLETRQWADGRYFRELDEEAEDIAAQTRRSCLAIEAGPISDVFRNTLTEETTSLRSEREELERYLELFA